MSRGDRKGASEHPSLRAASVLTGRGSGTSSTGSARCAWTSSSSCAPSSTWASAASSTGRPSRGCAPRSHTANDPRPSPSRPSAIRSAGFLFASRPSLREAALLRCPSSRMTDLRIQTALPASEPAGSPRAARPRKGRENFSAGSTPFPRPPEKSGPDGFPSSLARPGEPRRQTGQEAGQKGPPETLGGLP